MNSYVINYLQVDLLKGLHGLGDLALTIEVNERLMLARSALSGRIQLEQKRIITSHPIRPVSGTFPREWDALKGDVPKAAVAFKSFLGAFGTDDSLG